MKVRLQRRNRYSEATNTEKESIAEIMVDVKNGTAEYNGRIYRYTPICGTKFGHLGSKKSCYYIIEIISE